MVKLVLGNVHSKIVGFLPDYIHAAIDKDLSYKVPNARHMPSVKKKRWDGIIHLYMKRNGCSFYTGLLSFVRDILKKNDIEYQIVDNRGRPDQNLPQLAFGPSSNYEERDYQQFTVDRAIRFTRGVLGMATGAGKTMVVTNLISRIKTYPFMFYVLTKDLMHQAHDTLSTCLNQPIGMIGDGRADVQKISVCTIQTAIQSINSKDKKIKISDYQFDDEDKWDEKGIESVEKAERIRKLIRLTKGIYVDECVSGDAEVVTEKGVVRIDEIKDKNCKFVKTYNGNNVVFKPILNWWNKGNRETIKIETSCGKRLICTKDHLIYTQRGFIKAEDVLRTDKLFCADVDVGRKYRKTNIGLENTFLGTKLKNEQKKNGKNFIKNILRDCHYAHVGVARKFCHCVKRWMLSLSTRVQKRGMQSILRGMISNRHGRNIILSQQSERDKQYWGRVSEIQVCYCPTGDQRILGSPATMELISWNGSGIKQISCLDMGLKSKSSLIQDMVRHGQECILFACRPLQKLRKYFISKEQKKLLAMSLGKSERWGWHGGCVMTEVGLKNIFCYIQKGSQRKKMMLFANGFVVKGILAKFAQAKNKIKNIITYFFQKSHLGSCLTKSENMFRNACNTNWCKIEKITSDMRRGVYDIEVQDTHCFFANGILVHNCHHASARTVKEVLSASPNAFWRYGGSATPYRETGDDIMIQAMFGSKIVDINASYLIKNNWLVKPYIYFVPIDSDTGLHSYPKIYEHCITKNDELNDHVSKTANHIVSRGMSTLILVKHYPQGDYLKKLIPNSEFMTGRMKSDKRKECLKDLREKKLMCMIATSLADEGLDVPTLDSAILAGGGASSTRVNQRIGRTIRKEVGSKKDKSIVVTYEHNARHLSKHAKKVRKILKKEPEFVLRNSKGMDFINDEIDEAIGVESNSENLFSK